MAKSLVHPPGTGTGENIIQGLAENIAQSQHALGIQATGNHGAVHQDGEMIAQAPAVPLPAEIRAGQLRPGKLRFRIEKNPGRQGNATFRPKRIGPDGRQGKGAAQPLQQPFVPATVLTGSPLPPSSTAAD